MGIVDGGNVGREENADKERGEDDTRSREENNK